MITANKAWLLVLCPVLLTACGLSVESPPASRPPDAAPVSDDIALATDPCAIRLQDISAVMLLYVSQHDQMPPALEDLRPLAGPDMPFTCPATGQPYVYVRSGLSVPGQQRVLVLYDAVPGPDGRRWGIAASPPDGNQPFTMLVVRLSPQVLNAYLQSAPPGK